MMIRREELPLYVQVREAIRGAVEAGAYESGRLPTGEALQEQFSVSAITVRRALKDLQEEGLLVRERGRGTFVRNRHVVQELNHISSWAETMEERSLAHRSEVLSLRTEPASAAVATALHRDVGTPVVYILRRRFVEETPVTLMTNFLPADLVPGIEEHIYGEPSLYRVLEGRYLVTLTVSQETVSARTATPEEARLLGVRTGAALLDVERIAFGRDERPIEYVVSLSRSDIYHYRVSLVGRQTRTRRDGGLP
jgi:GntR family transcriptional regulator